MKLISLFIIGLITPAIFSKSLGYFYSESQAENLKNINEEDISKLIAHNLGRVIDYSSKDTQNLINSIGNQNFMTPKQLNILFLAESSGVDTILSKSVEETTMSSGTLDFCSKTSITEKCLLENILSKDDSFVNSLKKEFSESKISSMVHFVSSDKGALSKFNNHAVGISYENGIIQVNDMASGSVFKIQKDIETSANEFLAPEYKIDLKNNIIFFGNEKIFECEKKENCSLISMAEDISSVNEVSKLLKKQEDPTLLIFHLKSLFDLNQFMTLKSKSHLIELVNSSFKKLVSKLSDKFKPSEISGQILFLNSKESSIYSASESHSNSKIRMLQETPATQDIPESDAEKEMHIIKIWFIVGFAFAVYFATMSLVKMEFKRDSLLYAKFLTVDSR